MKTKEPSETSQSVLEAAVPIHSSQAFWSQSHFTFLKIIIEDSKELVFMWHTSSRNSDR